MLIKVSFLLKQPLKQHVTGTTKAIYSARNRLPVQIKVFLSLTIDADSTCLTLFRATEFRVELRNWMLLPRMYWRHQLKQGTVGTVIGALTIGVINNGMNLMNCSLFYQMVVEGIH